MVWARFSAASRRFCWGSSSAIFRSLIEPPPPPRLARPVQVSLKPRNDKAETITFSLSPGGD
jgi:hypothetical protein